MAKQLNVSLAFTADTSKAKAELQDLQKQLTQLTNAPISNSGKGFFLTKEIQEASAAAADLKIKLQQATDVNTGKLDLNKFDQSLRQSGTSLKTYREALSNLGPAGDKVFASLASSIMKADVPLRTTNKLLNEFRTTLINTARWQISSSILHGFMGTLQSAYGYAQDLNQSLNNIRIVTGYNTDQMSKFAEQANKAAQSLSTTTTRYTDAALIYYQQGLSDEEVLGRAETTIKLANVSRQSTEEVSDQLTAIWNNFYDGSQNLEYYADVITALGAATASSSEEISTGLEKFAAVSKTVGLSYEYATAALATITATTRQSADTVGTGLRTLFTRLEGLKLGETLEDGVDLNKYSEALQSVGVQVLDTSGNLREMDDILEDLGSKWGQLERSQKMALAQTVGGVRQYTNLIALMDHWDFMQENLATARGSEGTLQQQADIYAQSWEAAQKRVQAAAEDIYQDLINDDFFITLLDGFKEVLNIINNTIDAVGGLKGVLIAVGAIVTNLFQKEIASEINRIGQNIRIATGQAAQATTARKAEAAQEMQQMTADSIDENTGLAMSAAYTSQGQLQQELINNASRLSEERKKELQTLLDINAAIGQNVIESGEEADAAERKLAADQKALALKMSRNASNDPYKEFEVNAYIDDMKSFGKMSSGASGLSAVFKNARIETNQIEVSLQNVNSALDRLQTEASGVQFDNAEGDVQTINEKIQEVQNTISSLTNESTNVLEGTKADADDLYKRFIEIESLINKVSSSRYNDATQIGGNTQERNSLQTLGVQAEQTGNQVEQCRQKVDQFGESVKKTSKEINNPKSGMTDFGQKVSVTAQAVTTAVMAVNNLSNAITTLADPNLTAFEKFTGILSSIAMMVPMVVSSFASLKTTFIGTGAAGEAMWKSILGPIGLVIAGVTAVTTVIGLYNQSIKQAAEAATKQAKESNEVAEASKKEKDSHRDLISSMSELLNRYEDDKNVKDQLDSVTRELTEAYNLEGDALAKLSGEQENYSKVLSQAYSAQRKELEKAKKDAESALEDYGKAIVADYQTKGVLFNKNTIGFQASSDQVDEAVIDLLSKNMGNLISYDDNLSQFRSVNVSIDQNQPEQVYDFYQNLLQTQKDIKEIYNEYDETKLLDISPVYKQITDTIKTLSPNLKEYENYLKQIREYNLQLNNFDLEKNVKSLQDFNIWQEQIKKSLKEYDENVTEEEINLAINDLIKKSLNPNLTKFQTYNNAIQDILQLNNKLKADDLIELFNKENFNESVIGIINWRTVTVNSFEDAYNAANRYLERLEILNNVSMQSSSIEKAITDFGSGLNKSNTSKLAEDINWGQKENKETGDIEIIDFIDFVHKNKEEQLEYLKTIRNTLNQNQIDLTQQNLDYTNNAIKEAELIKNSYGENWNSAVSWGKDFSDDYNIVQEAFKQHDKVEDFDDIQKMALSRSGGTNSSNFEQYQNATLNYKQQSDAILNAQTNIENYNKVVSESTTKLAALKIQEAFNTETLNELNEKRAKSIITQEDYAAALDSVIETELNKIKIDKDVFNQHVKNIKTVIEDEEAAKKLALANLKVQQGIRELGKNIDTYTENLKPANEDTLKYAESMNSAKDVMSQILGVSKENISDDFILKNLEDIKLAAENDINALERLRTEAGSKVLLDIDVSDNEELESKINNVLADLEAADLQDIKLGVSIDDVEALNSYVDMLNEMLRLGQITADDVTNALNGINFDPEITYDTIPFQDDDRVIMHASGTVSVPVADPSSETGFTMKEVPYETAQEAYASGGSAITVPRINGKKTVSKGGVDSNASVSNKGGKGGGGGSAPKPAKKQKTTDPNTGVKDIDRYIKINQQLDEKEHENTMADARLKATSGRSAIKVMEEQLGILKQQKILYDELAKEAENYRVQDLEKLKKDFADLNFDINSDGILINYEDLLKAETEAYNTVQTEWNQKIIEAEKAYNDEFIRLGTAATEEALKPWKDALDKIKEESEEPLEEAAQRYELFKKDTDKYNDSVEQERKANEEAIQKANEEYSKELEIIAKGVELKIKVDDADLQYLEFLLEQIGEGADRALDRMSNFSWQLEDNMNKIDKYQEGLDKVLEHAGLDYSDLLNGDIDGIGTFNEEDLSKVEEYRDGLIACGEQLLELRKTILEEVSAAFDEFNSDLDRAIDRVDHLRRFTETYKNILDIVGKDVVDPTGRTTNMLARTAFTQAQANANALQTQLDMQLSAIDDYNRTIANLQSDNRYGEHDDTIKEFKNQLKEAEDAYAATQEEWLGAWEETVQAAADIYETTMLQIIEDFGKSISGLAGSLEELDTRFNRAKSLADTYVDDYEKIYQLSKLNRDINNSIDDTDNIRSKQRLRDLQEQINDLQASDNQMSEYEIENLRRRYELELAYLQLEEARDAKSQVRMVRDNEGNWGYIYTADETAVEEAEQNYEDKLYAMQKANTEYIESLESEILQLEQEWADALAGIRVQDYASYEEYQEAIDRTNDYYTQKLDQTYEQMGIAIDNNKVLYDEDWAAYSAATGYKISEDERFIDDFKETTLSLTTGYQTIEDAQNAFREATLNVTNDMVQAFQDWERDTNTSLELGGTNIQNYAEDVNEAINGDGGIVDQTEDAVEAAETMSDEYQDAFTEIIDYAGTFCSDFDDIIQRVIDDCNEAVDAIRRLVEAMDRENERNNNNNNEDTYANWEAQFDKEGKLSGWKAKDRNGNYITGSGKKLYWGGNEQISGYTTTYDFDANGNLIIDGKNAIGSGFAGSTLSEEMKRKLLKEAAHADTGMYTGNWGSSEGRLAVLHEKELVLDKDDTSNFLSAIGMIRDISSMIDLNSITSSNLMASMFGIRGVSTGTDTLEQDVTIHAEFPNVQNHSEIEEAFDNLINKASQYANRKI